MSAMTQTALSDCSYPDSTAYNIRDEIEATITRLKAVIEEEASLHKALHALFVKRKEEAIAKVKEANLHLYSVNEEEVAFVDDLCRAAAAAHEKLKSPMSLVNVNANAEGCLKDATSTRTYQEEGTKDYQWTPAFYSQAGFLHQLTPAPNLVSKVVKPSPLSKEVGGTPLAMEPKFEDNLSPGSPPESIRTSSQDDALRRPATPGSGPDYSIIAETPPRPTPKSLSQTLRSRWRSSSALDRPRSPAHSTNGLGAEPPARLTRKLFDDPPKSPVKSTHAVFDKPPRSPANSTHASEPPVSPARFASGIYSTRFNTWFVPGPDGSPTPTSPARSVRGLPRDAPFRSPARSSQGPEGPCLSPTATIHRQQSPGKTQATRVAFSFDEARGRSLKALANNHLGERLNSGYQRGAVVGTPGGAATNDQYCDPNDDFELADGKDRETFPAMILRDPTPPPPEEPTAIVVAPKKSKKGTKNKKGMRASPPPDSTVDADAGERVVMERKLLEEEEEARLEAELKRMEEAQFAEQERLEESRLMAEEIVYRLEMERKKDEMERHNLEHSREEQERLAAEEKNKWGLDDCDAERWMAEMREQESREYRLLEQETADAEERLAESQAYLDALSARRELMDQRRGLY